MQEAMATLGGQSLRGLGLGKPTTMLTSVQVGVGLVGSQEHGLSRLQLHQVEEVNGEAADVPRVL